ncbi:MAG TPA: bifunctional rhamnulose-1-phosphate aldolase/short-chain dehydrogenase [Armatimonadota bacterium]|jgi:rhamnulose-1-phosphate aldolase/alcohol dehydrogenase
MQPIVNLWNDSEAAALGDVDILAYVSRLLGADPSLVVWGGGNTSIKTSETDFRGRHVAVLRVKGSGSDLKAAKPADFPAVFMDDLLPLLNRGAMNDEEMVSWVNHSLLEPNSPRPSIETLLHAFVPAKCVLHSHADAIVALTNNERGEEVIREVFGEDLGVIPYIRPGFRMSQMVGEAARKNPALKGVVLMNHGLVTWHDDPREAYALHVEMANRAVAGIRHPAFSIQTPESVLDAECRMQNAASLAPTLRGLLGADKRVVMRYDDSEDVLRFVNWDRAPEATRKGAATPDHILSSKRRPMWVIADNPADIESLRTAAREGLEDWHRDYRQWYETFNSGEEMLPPYPRVILVKGLGMFTAWDNSARAVIPADIYHHTISIIEAAESIAPYRSQSDADAFASEYWPLELYKLTLAPPEKELARRVALVTGAAGAIGAGIARKFAAAGAHVICADLDLPKAPSLASDITAANKANPALAVEMDVTSEPSVQAAFRQIALAYGGIDILVSNAGIAHSCPIDCLELADWQRSLDVNATGHFLVAREALRMMKQQGTGGSLVFIATKNVTSPGKDFAAYSAAKSAEAQLAKVLALEAGPFGIRSNMVNPDAVFEGSGLWSDEVREQRAKAQGIRPEEIEEFYRKRNILQANVTAEDVAEAALFLASDRSAKTTGAMIPVDGGIKDAFPR